jgi:hypothetical protein
MNGLVDLVLRRRPGRPTTGIPCGDMLVDRRKGCKAFVKAGTIEVSVITVRIL